MKFIKKNTMIYAIVFIYILMGFINSVVFAKQDLKPIQNANAPIGMVNFSLKDKSFIILNEHKSREPIEPSINFKHGDVSWLPSLALQAGWPKDTHKRLSEIILRESGGCPNRFGGSIVDKNCNIIGHDGSNHRSDSGLLQINGVNWDPKRDGKQLLCAEYEICTQEQLLDPLINLKAGYILYQKVGWGPWDPCAWGPKFVQRCKP